MRRDFLLELVLRASPAFLFIGAAVLFLFTLSRREESEPQVGVLCSLACFGVFAVALLLPIAWRRILGLLELRATVRALAEARKLIDAGRPEVAADKLSATAAEIVGKLYAYHALVIASAGVAYVLAGQVELGHALLDGLERSGWLRALSLRAFRDAAWASIATLRAISGDIRGAEHALSECRGSPAHADAVASARVIVACRRGDADARAQIASLLASGSVATVRGRATLLAIDGALAHAAGDVADSARLAAEVAALRPRLFAHLRAGWPEVAAWLVRHGVTDATAA